MNTTLTTAADTALAPESFVLQRGVADRASISEGAIYLLLPTGEYARVEVPREDVARVARVLLGRPAVLLLAHDAPLPALAEASIPAKTYEDGVTDAARAVANVMQEYGHTTLPRIALSRVQDALVTLKSGTAESVDIANVGDVDITDLLARIDIAADQALDGQGFFHKGRSAVRRIVSAAVRAAFQSPPPVLFDPALHLVRAEVVDALKRALDVYTHDPVLAGLLARFRTVSEAA